MLRCDRNGCDETIEGTRPATNWYELVASSGTHDFCSWRCVGEYAETEVEAADAKVKEKEMEAERPRPLDDKPPREP